MKLIKAKKDMRVFFNYYNNKYRIVETEIVDSIVVTRMELDVSLINVS